MPPSGRWRGSLIFVANGASAMPASEMQQECGCLATLLDQSSSENAFCLLHKPPRFTTAKSSRNVKALASASLEIRASKLDQLSPRHSIRYSQPRVKNTLPPWANRSARSELIIPHTRAVLRTPSTAPESNHSSASLLSSKSSSLFVVDSALHLNSPPP